MEFRINYSNEIYKKVMQFVELYRKDNEVV